MEKIYLLKHEKEVLRLLAVRRTIPSMFELKGLVKGMWTTDISSYLPT